MSRGMACRACGHVFPRDPVLEVACPHCGAQVGETCKRPSGHQVWNPWGRFCWQRDIAADDAGAYDHSCTPEQAARIEEARAYRRTHNGIPRGFAAEARRASAQTRLGL